MQLPGVKVLCILRNPIDRAYSHYWHAREKGPERAETFEAALDREERRIRRHPEGKPAVGSYVDRGRYIDQLIPLADAVGRDNLHVLLMDDLLDDPAGTLHHVFQFLGVDIEPAIEIALPRSNAYGVGESTRQSEWRDRPLRSRLGLPAGRYEPMFPDTRRRLAGEFAEVNALLAAWLGRNLDHWA